MEFVHTTEEISPLQDRPLLHARARRRRDDRMRRQDIRNNFPA